MADLSELQISANFMRRAILAFDAAFGTRVMYLLLGFEIREDLPQVLEFLICGPGLSRLAERFYAFPPFLDIGFLLIATGKRCLR